MNYEVHNYGCGEVSSWTCYYIELCTVGLDLVEIRSNGDIILETQFSYGSTILCARNKILSCFWRMAPVNDSEWWSYERTGALQLS